MEPCAACRREAAFRQKAFRRNGVKGKEENEEEKQEGNCNNNHHVLYQVLLNLMTPELQQ